MRNKAKALYAFGNNHSTRRVVSWFHSPKIRKSTASPTNRLMLLMLASHVVRDDEKNLIYNEVDERLTYADLGELCGISRGRAKDVVQSLERGGAVRIIKGTSRTSPRFQVHPWLMTQTCTHLGTDERGLPPWPESSEPISTEWG